MNRKFSLYLVMFVLIASLFLSTGGQQVVYANDGDGTWETVGITGIDGVDGTVYATVIYQGNLVVGGDFTIAGDVYANNIAMWNGSNWSAIGTGFDAPVEHLAVYGTSLYASGWNVTEAGGVSLSSKVGRWNGSTWSDPATPSLNTDFVIDDIQTMGIDNTGKLYLGGRFDRTGTGKTSLVVYLNSGTWTGKDLTDTSTADNYPRIYAESVAVSTSGDWYVAVDSGDLSGNPNYGNDLYGNPIIGVAQIISGTLEAFGDQSEYFPTYQQGVYVTTTNTVVTVRNVHPDGYPQENMSAIYGWDGSQWVFEKKIYEGGNSDNINIAFHKYNGQDYFCSTPNLTSYLEYCSYRTYDWLDDYDTYENREGYTWSPIVYVTDLGADSMNGTFYDFAVDSTSGFYIGGYTTNFQGLPARGITYVKNNTPKIVSANTTSGKVTALTGSNEGIFYAVGSFNKLNGVSTTAKVAKIEDGVWSAVGSNLTRAPQVIAVTKDGTLYAGGYATLLSGKPLIRWTGSTWVAESGYTPYQSYTTISQLVEGKDGSLYIVDGSAVVKYKDGVTTVLGRGNSGITNLWLGEDDSVYVNGSFTSMYVGTTGSTVTATRSAKWNGSSWSALPTTWTGAGTAKLVYASSDGVMYFSVYDNSSVTLLKYDGSNWTDLTDATVNGVTPENVSSMSNGNILIKGYKAGDYQRCLYEYNTTGSNWVIIGCFAGDNATYNIQSLSSSKTTNDLMVYGLFSTIDDVLHPTIVQYHQADTIAPVILSSLSTTSWTNEGVTVSSQAVDGSDVGAIYCKTSSDTEYTAGTGDECAVDVTTEDTSVEVYAMDTVGNTTEINSIPVDNIDTTAPDIDSTVVTESNGVESETPTSLASPVFVWNPIDDMKSGTAGYYVYWGMNPVGTSTNFITTTAYTPDPVTITGTYYLRMQGKDEAGNLTDWRTIFIYNYENSDPESGNTCVINSTQGCTITVSGIDMVFPAGLVDNPTVIDFTESVEPNYALPASSDSLVSFELNGTEFDTSTPVSLFADNYSISYTYTDEQLSALGVAEETLQLAYYDEVALEWVPVFTALDTANNLLNAQLDHFTDFAVIGTVTSANGDIMVIINSGPIQVSPQEINFGEIELTGELIQTVGATADWTVLDATGLGQGWYIDIRALDFDSGDGHSIAINNMSMDLGDEDISTVNGNEKPVSILSNSIIMSTSSQVIMNAGTGQGMGTYQFVPAFDLTIPASAYAGSYSSTVYVTVTAGAY